MIPTNVLKNRLARNWCKQMSVKRYDYLIAERHVINNKPHIVLKTAPQVQQQMAMMAGMSQPVEVGYEIPSESEG